MLQHKILVIYRNIAWFSFSSGITVQQIKIILSIRKHAHRVGSQFMCRKRQYADFIGSSGNLEYFARCFACRIIVSFGIECRAPRMSILNKSIVNADNSFDLPSLRIQCPDGIPSCTTTRSEPDFAVRSHREMLYRFQICSLTDSILCSADRTSGDSLHIPQRSHGK